MINQQRVAFFIRAYNDVDHFTPVIAEFVKRNANPVVFVNSDFIFDDDYRFQYLKQLGSFEIFSDTDSEFIEAQKAAGFFGKIYKRIYQLKRSRNSIFGKIYRRFWFCSNREIAILKEYNISTCVFEWCSPFERGELVEKYFMAAKAIGIKTISLPHGCNIFVNSDVTVGYRRHAGRAKLVDQSDRNLFDYYIVQNPLRRDGWIKWGQDPIKTQAWGSARFYPEWAALNRDICPAYSNARADPKKINVVFMQFQKEYNLKNEEIFDCLVTLSRNQQINLVVKDATREGKSFYDKEKVKGRLGNALIEWVGNDIHSPALVDWADIVVVIGGSIGIEVILQRKILIYPVFLNENKTLYEELEAANICREVDEIEELISNFKGGNLPARPLGESLLIREIVYAGLDVYDVPDFYYRQINSPYLNYGIQTVEQIS
ncbi:hypothetical protein N9Y07_06675 [Alphaproteobacteria bacterium]|nr:hypothetical protein [Alphaproteobacteria bacterium]